MIQLENCTTVDEMQRSIEEAIRYWKSRPDSYNEYNATSKEEWLNYWYGIRAGVEHTLELLKRNPYAVSSYVFKNDNLK